MNGDAFADVVRQFFLMTRVSLTYASSKQRISCFHLAVCLQIVKVFDRNSIQELIMDVLNEEKQKLLEAIRVLVLKRKYLAALAILQATDFQLLTDVISQDTWMDNEESCIAGRKWLGWLSEMHELPEDIKTEVSIAFSKLSMVICGSFKILRPVKFTKKPAKN
jgi:hypothetical protein